MQQQIIEIACDESGFTGTNLLDGDAGVFAHASVLVDEQTARRWVSIVRETPPYSGGETKANHLLRDTHRPVLEWFLRDALRRRAHVHLTHKPFFVVTRIVDLLAGELTYASATSLDRSRWDLARTLYHRGPTEFGDALWREFLGAAAGVLRLSKNGDDPVDRFFATLARLPHGRLLVMDAMASTRERASSYQASLQTDIRTMPALEPLLSAIVQTVIHWEPPVTIVHDEQSALTPHRIGRIQQLLDGRLSTLRRVDSRLDPRVQVADFLAGAARRIISDELSGRGDPALLRLLRPYVDPYSIWYDDRWAASC